MDHHRLTPWTVEVEVGGRHYRGRYLVEDGVLVVRAAFGQLTFEVTDEEPAQIAERLLEQLAREGRA